MDELFDRIRTIKIKRRILVTSLILTELLGILVLVWFLRIPLSQKYLISPPKSFSLEVFDSNKQYLVGQEDFITGNSTPESNIKILIAPGDFEQTVFSSPEGNFSFQVPNTLSPGEYQIIINHNSEGETLSKSYRIRIVSNNKLVRLLPFL